MPSNLQTVDGRVVTTTETDVPSGWTSDYEAMGGDETWDPEGEIAQMVQACGFEGEVKPFLATEDYTGEALSLFEVGDSQYFIYNAIDTSLFRVDTPDDLHAIAAVIGDESQGLAALDLDQVA
ncbi:hypothetical protein ACHAPJ_013433 [Fusarium lateritium]